MKSVHATAAVTLVAGTSTQLDYYYFIKQFTKKYYNYLRVTDKQHDGTTEAFECTKATATAAWEKLL
jgi:hypothetical protein